MRQGDRQRGLPSAIPTCAQESGDITVKPLWLCAGLSAILAACSATGNRPEPIAPPPPPAAPEPPTLARDPTPRNPPGNWITTNDYPSRALREEREGAAQFRLTVGVDGRVAECSILSSSGHADLDTATCSNITRRARFDPARDAEGNPTIGTYSNGVTWMINRTERLVLEPLPLAGSYTISMVVRRDGFGGNCRVARSAGDLAALYPVGPRLCRSIYMGTPFTDRRGRPVSRSLVTRREVRIRDVAEDFVPRISGQTPGQDGPRAPRITGRVVWAYIVEADGRQTNCRIVSVSGDMAISIRVGAYRCRVTRFERPFVDASGRPKRRQVEETERVSVERRR